MVCKGEAIYEESFQSSFSTNCFVTRFIQELDQAQQRLVVQVAALVMTPSRWISPPASLMKINVDAVISNNTGMASMAAVARDAAGQFIVPRLLPWKGCLSQKHLRQRWSEKGWLWPVI